MGKVYSRRYFLRLAGLGATGTLLAACGAGQSSRLPTATPVLPKPTQPPASSGPPSLEEAQAQAKMVVGDVVDYLLDSNEWPGLFGVVTLKLHEAFYNGDMVYHIRTDASDPTFAQANGLVHVPLLNAALPHENVTSPLYVFENGIADQRPVVTTVPGQDAFSPALRIHVVKFNGAATLLDSATAIETAAADGDVTIEKQNLIVNYPFIKWPGGGLTVDTELVKTLGPGQLFNAPDTAGMTVKMKLHQCYPGSRYIVTDTSIAEMAPMMAISASPPTKKLAEIGATDEIWVFGNGIEGSSVMGFQPAIFDNKATEPAWSPFWNHFTLVWKDSAEPRVLKSSAEVRAAIEAGDLDEFNGVPDTHPTGFVVNCPAPILSPNTFA